MNSVPSFHLFEAFGVELEYMIVRADSLDVLPLADRVLHRAAGEDTGEVDLGLTSWSNELVRHLIELKNTDPVPALADLPLAFQENIQRLNHLLEPDQARLMPTGMHPWMDPVTQTQLWAGENCTIYQTFHRLFNCYRHGWANLQSVHLNLPFADDAEFGRLHAAVRLLLPILPALAASSPFQDGRATGFQDNRLEVYRTNSSRIPAITGLVIPEPVFGQADYEASILQPMYQAIAALDPEGILQHEWLNSRGAIARFDRDTIEIRLMDVQECPRADLALCAAVVSVLRNLVEERWTDQARQRGIPTEILNDLLLSTMRSAEEAVLDSRPFLEQFGFRAGRCTARELWGHLLTTTGLWPGEAGSPWTEPLGVMLQRGPLAPRILRALGGSTDRDRLAEVYRCLCDCLARGVLFEA